VEKIALALLDREVLHQQDVEDLIGKRPYEEKKIFAIDENETMISNDVNPDATAEGSSEEQKPA
jgi:hypothetical protein